MRYSLRISAAAAVLAAAACIPHAQAATAQVAISDVTVTISSLDERPWETGNWPWIAQNTGPGWPASAESTVVEADITDAAVHQQASGWLGTNRAVTASAAKGSAEGSAEGSAHAGVSFAGADLFSPGAAWSFASAVNGESASAVARLWDAAFMVGARTQIVVNFKLDSLSAQGDGGTASALASLAMWSGEFGSDLVSAEAQVIASPDYAVSYDGPWNLSVTWRNSSVNMAVAQVALLTSAQVLSATPVPEPAPAWLLLAGLAGVAGWRKRVQAKPLLLTLAGLMGIGGMGGIGAGTAHADEAQCAAPTRSMLTAPAGSTLQLSVQKNAARGALSWSGCGLNSSAASVTLLAKASCTVVASYRNSCGAASSTSFAISVPGMRDLSSVQLSKLMGAGWNLGNSLEAQGSETAWGNPPVTQAMFNAVRAAGFKTVRLPVAWKQYADADDNISAAWLARVTQVVGYAKKAGLYTLINIHWDGGWMVPDYAHQAAVNARLSKFWTQIANNFKDADDMLLFAGSNEVMMEGNYGPPTAENVAVQNSFNQTFVDAVRATGGNNLARHLVVQSYNTGVDNAVSYTVMPTDSVALRMLLEVHFYDPYFFTLAANYWDGTPDKYWQWGSIVVDPAASPEHWADEAYVDAQFQKLKSRFVDQGVAVILGEFGAIARLSKDPAGTYRTYWDQYIARSAWLHGAVPVYWDAGATGEHSMGLFNRKSTLQVYPKTIKAIVNAAK